MSAAANRKLSEQAQSVGKAAEAIDAVREALAALRELASIDPQTCFGHTVRDHRAAVETFDSILRDIGVDGRGLEQAACGAGLGKEAVTIIRAAHIRVRVLRTLAAVLSGDANALANEDEPVRTQVEQVLAQHAERNARHWSRAELDAFSEGARPFSQAFEARLNGS